MRSVFGKHSAKSSAFYVFQVSATATGRGCPAVVSAATAAKKQDDNDYPAAVVAAAEASAAATAGIASAAEQDDKQNDQPRAVIITAISRKESTHKQISFRNKIL